MKKLLSLMLVVCMLMSAFGTVTAFGETASGGGGAVGGGGSSSVIPSTPSIGGGGSSSGGSGGSSYQAANWELYSNGVECNSGAYHPGDLVIDGNITTISGSYDIFVIIAQYDDSGALIRNDIRRKTVSAVDTSLYAELNDVDVNGIVKCMVIRADNLKPITPSKIYVPFGRSMIIDISQLASALIGGATDSIVKYYASRESSRTDKIYVSAYPTITVNGVQVPNNNQFDLLNYMNYMAQVRFVETSGDNYFDCVAVTVYEYGIVEEVLPDRDRINFIDGYKVTYDSSDPYQIVNIYDKSGKVITLNDIKPGDVLVMIVGELDYSGSYCPVRALNFSEKLTIYNLGNNKITGTVTGWDSVDQLLYIDGVVYQYSYLPWVTDDDYSDLVATGDPLGQTGDFYLDINGRIIGFDGSAYVTYDVGFIIDTQLNSGGFEPQWMIKLLTKDGIGVYNVDTQCEIDGIYCDINSDMASQNRLDFSKYSNGSGDEFSRSIEYETNKNGEIDTITFLENKTIVRSYSLYEESYRKATNKLGNRILSDKLCIFNVATSDIEEATAEDISALIDGNSYSGLLIDMNNDVEVDFYIATSGELLSDKEPEVEPDPVVSTGLIVNTFFNTTSFEPYWQIKVLTENGILVHNVNTRCEINGALYDLSNNPSAQEMLNVGLYDPAVDNISDRMIEYETSANNVVGKITFVNTMQDAQMYTVSTYEGGYMAATNTICGRTLADNICIYNVTMPDINDATAENSSVLIDGISYGGTLIDIDGDGIIDIFAVVSGDLDKGTDEPEESPAESVKTGFIIQSNLNTNSFENHYQMRILTDDEGVVVYSVSENCRIDGIKYSVDEQSGMLEFDAFNASDIRETYDGRMVEFELNTEGRINKIQFVGNMPDTKYVYIQDEEFYATRSALGSRSLDADIVIFDVASSDYETKDISSLYDKSYYGGVLFDVDNDSVMDMFVMTYQAISFDEEGSLFVVDSISNILYGDDYQEAVQVKYYTEGVNKLNTAIFTEDSVNVLDSSSSMHAGLSKGALFTAILGNDGLVEYYAVIASISNYSRGYNLNGNITPLTMNVYGSDAVGNSKCDGVEFVYGYISDIMGSTVVLGGTEYSDYWDGRNFIINSSTSQYCFNTNGIKPKIDVGDYMASGVDVYDSELGRANLVFMKVYNDRVIDIISFSQRVYTETPGIIAQTHYSGLHPGLDLN